MSLLSMMGNVMGAMGFPAPTAVMSSTDTRVIEMLAISNTSGKAIARAYNWTEITREQTFTATAAYDQGAFNSTIVTLGDFDRLVNGTLWNRSAIMQAAGPVGSTEWQSDVAFQAAAPAPKFRIWQGHLWVGPVGTLPTAGNTWAFEFVSKNWCQSAAGVAQSAWVADTDTGILDEDLLKLDAIWRWKASKSLEYADDLANFTDAFNLRIGQTTGARSLYIGGANISFPVNVPEGNWPS